MKKTIFGIRIELLIIVTVLVIVVLIAISKDLNLNEKSSESSETLPETIEHCYKCKYIYTTTPVYPGKQAPKNVVDDYRKLNKNVFLGLNIDEDTGVIEYISICGIEGETPFCLDIKGKGSKSYAEYELYKYYGAIYRENLETLNAVFTDCDEDDCYGSSVNASVSANGSAVVENSDGKCKGTELGNAFCDDK